MAIDIETTGLNPNDSKIIEIGAIVMEGKQEIASFSRLINPEDKLPEQIIKLTGITDAMLQNEATEQEVIGDFLDFCDNVMSDYEESDVILGHNIAFDYSFLKTAAVRLKRSFKRRVIDTLYIARKLHPQVSSKSLSNMCKHYKIAHEVSHRAFEDAIAASNLYESMKTLYGEKESQLFLPQAISYTPKKQEPMTWKQKKYLLDLVSHHHLEVPENIDEFTKSKASKYIDKIILEYGLLYHR